MISNNLLLLLPKMSMGGGVNSYANGLNSQNKAFNGFSYFEVV